MEVTEPSLKKIKKLLLVDDDETANFLNLRLLRRLDVVEELITATNGQEALDYMEQNCLCGEPQQACADVILLDINMPVMNGFEFLEQFSNLPCRQDIKVYILSSSTYERDLEKAQVYKIAGYISKPLTEEKLLYILHNS